MQYFLRAGNRIENSISSYLDATASHKSVPFCQRLCFGNSTFSVFSSYLLNDDSKFYDPGTKSPRSSTVQSFNLHVAVQTTTETDGSLLVPSRCWELGSFWTSSELTMVAASDADTLLGVPRRWGACSSWTLHYIDVSVLQVPAHGSTAGDGMTLSAPWSTPYMRLKHRTTEFFSNDHSDSRPDQYSQYLARRGNGPEFKFVENHSQIPIELVGLRLAGLSVYDHTDDLARSNTSTSSIP